MTFFVCIYEARGAFGVPRVVGRQLSKVADMGLPLVPLDILYYILIFNIFRYKILFLLIHVINLLGVLMHVLEKKMLILKDPVNYKVFWIVLRYIIRLIVFNNKYLFIN